MNTIRLQTDRIQLINSFLKATGPTDNFKSGYRQIYIMKPIGDKLTPQELCFFKPDEARERLKKLHFSDNRAYYTTKNSFYANYRQNNSIFSLDNIVLDCDAHKSSLSSKDLNHEIDRLVYSLETDYSNRLPSFNLTRSGRGAHLWIGLESFSPKLKYLHNIAALSFCDTVRRCIYDNQIQLDVDTAASMNAAGLIRLPYTVNQSNGELATFEIRTDKRYILDELQQYSAINVSDNGDIIEKSIERRCAHTEEERQKYIPLNRKRLYFLDIIIEQSDSLIGRRDLVLFLYANAAYQLTGSKEETETAVYQANQKLDMPLSSRELDSIIQYICKKGGLDFKKTTFLNFMAATEQERWIYMNGMQNNREIERQQAREKKAARDAKILELHKKGYSLREIATEMSCAVNTVRSVITVKDERTPK